MKFYLDRYSMLFLFINDINNVFLLLLFLIYFPTNKTLLALARNYIVFTNMKRIYT